MSQNHHTYLPKILRQIVVVCHCRYKYMIQRYTDVCDFNKWERKLTMETYCSDWFFIDITLLLRAINIGGCNKNRNEY